MRVDEQRWTVEFIQRSEFCVENQAGSGAEVIAE